MNQDTNKLLDEARLLIPWYLTKGLSEEEQALFAQALAIYPELQQECAHEEKMMHTVCANTSLLELAALDTTEQRLTKLLAYIERSELSKSNDNALSNALKSDVADVTPERVNTDVATTKVLVRVAEPSGFSQWWRQVADQFSDWLRPVNVIFASLLIAQFAVLVYYYQSETDYSEAIYTPVNLSPRAVFMVEKDRELSSKEPFLVKFKLTEPLANMHSFLLEHEASIVSGPHGDGLYLVAMSVPQGVDKISLASEIEIASSSINNSPIEFFGATTWDAVFAAE